jgi:hypothetical protein
MLAVIRTDNVIGRIILLVISIMNMKLISKVGVPIGIVWINIFFVMYFHANVIIVIQVHKDNVNEIEM